MKKYTRVTCNHCHRTVDQYIDLQHYIPDKCTITLGCEGRLTPVELRSNATIAVTPINGVKDWHKRNGYNIPSPVETLTAKVLSIDNSNVEPAQYDTVSLLTGNNGQIVIGVTPNVGAVLPATLDIAFRMADDTPQEYRAYIYRMTTSFSTISGKESGLGSKVLRYTSSDVVEVRVNGVLRSQGTGPDEYQINTSTASSVPPNTVRFNTTIDNGGTTQVDIIVTKSSPAKLSTVVFKRHDNTDETRVGAYENVDSVARFENGVWVEYELYTADLSTSGLKLNSVLVPDLVQPSSHLIDHTKSFFLLANKPYRYVDRNHTVFAPFSGFHLEEKRVVKYSSDRSGNNPTITASFKALGYIYPPLTPKLFKPELPLTTGLSGVREQTTVDGGVIVGPDK